MTRPSRPRLGRATASAVGALVLSLSFAGSALASERATFRLLGSSPIYAGAVDVHKATGGSAHVRPARYHYRITTGTPGTATEASGNCVDMANYIVTGRDYQVDLQTAADAPELASPAYLSAGWLQSQADALLAAAPNANFEAGAIQVAIWQLSGQARELDAPTSDAALNARVSELRALAAGRQIPSDLAVSMAGGGDTCLNTGAPISVSGTPGAVVDLSVTAPGTTAPAATVDPARVTIGPNGDASAVLRSATPGTVTVTATTSAPTLIRAVKLGGSSSPQDQLFLRPRTLTAQTQHTFIDCDLLFLSPDLPVSAAPSTPEPPIAPPGGPAVAPQVPTPPAVTMSLESPRTAAPGSVAVYRLRVTNSGTRVARGVRVTQHLGHGVSPLAARGPKGTSGRVARNAAGWTLAPLKAGRSTTLILTARVARSLAGDISTTTAALKGFDTAPGAESATTAVVRRVGPAEQGF